MEIESLSAALEREHREIDAGIAAFTASPGNAQPLAGAIQALRRHIYLGERVLYPRADDVLPERWVCIKARPAARDAGR